MKLKSNFPHPIEGYYIESSDGLIFATKGLIHPPERIIAFVRYVPHTLGKRKREGVRYKRVYNFEEQYKLLKEKYPQYLFFDQVFDSLLQGVPNENIKFIYNPCYKLRELQRSEKVDLVEANAVEFIKLLRENCKVRPKDIGISGSILVGLHTQNSDIDIVVYGSKNCLVVRDVLLDLLKNGKSVRRLNKQELRKLYTSRRVVDTGIKFKEFVKHEQRKVIQGSFKNREYFMRFIKHHFEIKEKYGDKIYRNIGHAKIRATITEDKESIFTPCKYGISNVHFIEGPKVNNLIEITSYRGRFCEQAKEDEVVIASGKLEKVFLRNGEIYHRLLIGNLPSDFLVVKL